MRQFLRYFLGLGTGGFGGPIASVTIIAVAADKLGRMTNRHDWRLWTISAILAVVTAVTGAEIAVLFIAAGRRVHLRQRPGDRPVPA